MARPKSGVTFWDRVNSQIGFVASCIVFTGCKDDCGYGRINKDGKLVRLHRAVWERDHGPIPDGMVIMHTCDNPACINPLHLVLGTQAANIKDMWNKERGARQFGNSHTKGKHINTGEKHGAARFTDKQVAEIKQQLRLDGSWANVCALAIKYSVSRGAIAHIRRGDRWSHVA